MKLRSSQARLRASDDLLAHLAARLTERDRHLCHMLHEHRVLTTAQITELAFDSAVATRHRLVTLYRLRVLDRFRPHRETGSAPYHYVLDEMGAAVLAAARGTDPDRLGYRRDKTLALAHNQRLAHTVGVNGFFTALAAAARRSDGNAELRRWWSERRCAATWGHIVRPDGYGRWREHDREVDFFLEYDRGTEPLDRVAAKLDAYKDLAEATGLSTTTVVWLPGPEREANLRRLITRPTVPVATAHPQADRSPSDALWLPAGVDDRRRLRLAELCPRVSPVTRSGVSARTPGRKVL